MTKNLGLTALLILSCACDEPRAGSEGEPPARAGSVPTASTGREGTDESPSVGASTSDRETPAVVGGPPVATGANDVGTPEFPVVRPNPVPEGLVVHEWGTFTSVNSSKGVLMEGLHHEEEALPSFVHGRATEPGVSVAPAMGKSLEGQPVAVTQKLETPVLYFYGAAKKGVRVRVDFPSGVVSQWFPAATRFGPALGAIDVPHSGFMEWVFDMAPEMTTRDFPSVSPDDIWAPSRNVASVPVAVGGERERFIFYRGLGAFELPLRTTVDALDRITIQNRSTDTSPALFLLRVHAGGGAIVELGALAGGGVLSGIGAPVGGKEHDLDTYVADAQNKIAAALERTGLYRDEARAMVETWTKSYFKSEGLRVLYVVPRAWTDTLLPLRVEPTPSAVVRTLVGRVELLAPSEEQALLAQVSDAAARSLPAASVILSMGRLAEPKLRRVRELATDPAVQSWTQSAVFEAATTP